MQECRADQYMQKIKSYLEKLEPLSQKFSQTSVGKKWQELSKRHQLILGYIAVLIVALLLFPTGEPEEKMQFKPVELSINVTPLADRVDQTDLAESVQSLPSNRLVSQTIESDQVLETKASKVAVATKTPTLDKSLAVEQDSKKTQWQEFVIKPSDTIAQIFREIGAASGELKALIESQSKELPLNKLSIGQRVKVKMAKNGTVESLELERTGRNLKFIRLKDGDFKQVN